MNRGALGWTAKALQAVGLVIVLCGLFISMSEGFAGRGLASMAYEFQGLFWGGVLFSLGVLLERRSGGR